MATETWQLNSTERETLAKERCEFLFQHVKQSGGAPQRTKSETTILVPSKEHIFSVSISPKDPRHITVSLAYSAPPAESKKAIEAAQLASQSTIVSKVRIEPKSDQLLFSVEASFFNEDNADLARTFGLYLAAILDTYERFVDELANERVHTRIGMRT